MGTFVECVQSQNLKTELPPVQKDLVLKITFKSQLSPNMMAIVFDWIWKNLFMNWCSFWAPSFFYIVPEISIREHSLKAKHAKGHTLLNYDMRREKRGKQIPWKEDKKIVVSQR